jgi:hypothetical protein
MLIFGNKRLTWQKMLLGCLLLGLIQLVFANNSFAAAPVDPAAGKGIATGLEKAWITLFTGDGTGLGSFFGTLANTFKGIGIIALVMQSTFVMVKFMSENNSSARELARIYIVERIIPNVLVISLLANNGINGGNAVLAMKKVFFSWDKVAYATMTDIATVLDSAPSIEGEKEAVQIIKSAFDTCVTIPAKVAGEDNPVLAECLAAVKQLVNENIASGKIKNKATVEQLNDMLTSVVFSAIPGAGAITELIKVGARLTGVLGASVGKIDPLRIFIETIGVVYNTGVEMALMITCLSLPLVLMLSLYKFQVLLKWLPQILNLFIAKISYTIAAGLALFLKASAGSDFGMWGYSVLLGIGAPLVSIFVAMSLSGSVGAVFEREVAKATAGVVRAVGTGTARAIGTVAAGPGGGMVAGEVANKTISVISRRV